MKKALVCLTLALCLGIFFIQKLALPFWLVFSTAALSFVLAVLFYKNKLRFNIILLCSVFFLGAVLFRNTQILPGDHITRCVTYKNNRLHTLKGFIYSEPVLKNDKISFIFNIKEIQSENLHQNCSGLILVYAQDKKSFRLGQELIITGDVYRPYRPVGSKSRSFGGYLSSRGIFFIMRSRFIRITGISSNRYIFKRLALYLKSKMEEKINKYLPAVPASILAAMILGERRGIPPLVNNRMIRAGTVHILVVSGFNTGIVVFIINLVLKLIRIPKVARFHTATFLLLVYCLLTGASAPVVRATVMAVVFMFAYLVRREPDIYNSLSVAAIFILGPDPRQLFDIGFQLSFISVFSIVYLYPKIKLFFRLNSQVRSRVKFIIDGCLVSLSAWLGTMGFIALNFKIFSPVTVVANIIIVPLAALITLCGFSLIIMGFACPALAPFFASSIELAVALLLHINNLLVKIPFASFQLP